jgi:GT2 family glycosyltransferase
MDDDVVPDIYCLENMLNHFAPQNVLFPLRYKPDGNPFLNDCMELNLSNPLKGIWKKVINQKDLDNIVIDVQGPTFEGPLFSKELIRKIGLPEKNFFIYADDTEYFIRASRAGFRLKLIRDAKLYRMLEAPVDGSFNWKTYYLIRNLTIIDKFYGNFIVKLLRPFAYILLFGKYWKNLSEVKTTFKAIIDGIFYKSSNTKEAVEKELNLKSTAQ